MIPGLVAAVAVGVAVVWGRIRDVEVPRSASWAETPIVCARDVDPAAVWHAVGWWAAHGQPVILSCGPGWTVSLDSDPTVDDRDSVEDRRGRVGTTRLRTVDGVIVAAEVRVVPGAGRATIAHELGHAFGWGHVAFAPSGHIMHPSRYGFDGRGIR